MLILSQRGYVKSSPPMRPLSHLPAAAQVTSVYWRINTDGALPPGVSMMICMPGKCLPLDGLAGRSDALAGIPADNPLVLELNMAGGGAIVPPVMLKSYQIQVNYRTGTIR
ncbi:flagellar protein FlhE [Sodalis sp. RH16]|uniref:flagellar protein FlhE n=1 Tax=Sodalis sp. RH16 TaxID=3394331 RepID=UPI0039B5C506